MSGVSDAAEAAETTVGFEVARISFFLKLSTCSEMVHPGLTTCLPDSSSSWYFITSISISRSFARRSSDILRST